MLKLSTTITKVIELEWFFFFVSNGSEKKYFEPLKFGFNLKTKR